MARVRICRDRYRWEPPGSIPLDLKYDQVPWRAIGKYHLTTNFGTTEHVVNQLNAFKVVHDLTAHNGIMLHHIPAQGMFNHGLVNYNPKFFWLVGRSNGYRVLDFDFFLSSIASELPENVRDYTALFRPDLSHRVKDYKSTDAMILAVFQKVYDIPFVPPIDVQTGSRTDNKIVNNRYWTVFRPDAFAHLPKTPSWSSRLRAWTTRLRGWVRTPPLELAKKVIRRVRRLFTAGRH